MICIHSRLNNKNPDLRLYLHPGMDERGTILPQCRNKCTRGTRFIKNCVLVNCNRSHFSDAEMTFVEHCANKISPSVYRICREEHCIWFKQEWCQTSACRQKVFLLQYRVKNRPDSVQKYNLESEKQDFVYGDYDMMISILEKVTSKKIA